MTRVTTTSSSGPPRLRVAAATPTEDLADRVTGLETELAEAREMLKELRRLSVMLEPGPSTPRPVLVVVKRQDDA